MDTPNPIIRIIDDEEDVRNAIQLMLDIEGWESRTYESASAFLTSGDTTRPGCVLLDVRMPNTSGLELQEIMHQRNIRLPIVFLTGHADIEVAISSLKHGAVDFLLKPVDDVKLLEAIAHAVEIDARIRAGLSSTTLVADGLSRLTERERELLTLIIGGLSDRVIAERFGISERTVQGHRARIYEKFRIHTARELQLLIPEISAALKKRQMPPS